MSIKMATWMCGNGAMVEHPLVSERRMAGSGLFVGRDITRNFFQFPLTTPVIINDVRPRLAKLFVTYRERFCRVEKVEAWSGGRRLFAYNVIPEQGQVFEHANVDRREFIADKSMFDLTEDFDPLPEIHQGLSISVKVLFDSRMRVVMPLNGVVELIPRNIGSVEFFSIGADWV